MSDDGGQKVSGVGEAMNRIRRRRVSDSDAAVSLQRQRRNAAVSTKCGQMQYQYVLERRDDSYIIVLIKQKGSVANVRYGRAGYSNQTKTKPLNCFAPDDPSI